MKEKNYFKVFIFLSVSFTVALTLYFSRHFIFNHQDIAHLTDLYTHSQWAVPLSTRSISDDQLYSVAGAQLAQGVQPFAINPEVPPLGKYLYGWSYLVFGSSFVASAVLYIGVVGLVYLLARSLGATTHWSLVALLVVSASPAVSSQVAQTMLDAPLMFFALLHLWCVAEWHRRQQQLTTSAPSKQASHIVFLVGAGVALGAFAAIKFPLFVPVLVLADIVLFFRAKQSTKVLLVFAVAALVFAASYARYFATGHYLLEWVRSLYWTTQFYQAGVREHLPLQLLPAVFMGKFLELTTEQMEAVVLNARVHEWSLLWPLSFLIGVFGAVLGLFGGRKSRRFGAWLPQLSLAQEFLVVWATLYIALLFFVGFQARYYFPLIPAMIALGASVVSKQLSGVKRIGSWQAGWALASGILVLGVAAQFVLYWHSLPTERLKEISRTWNTANYRDLYSFLEPNSAGVSREDFARFISRQLDQNLQAEQTAVLEFEQPSRLALLGRQTLAGTLELTMTAPEFTLQRQVPVMFVKHQGQWFLRWQWEWFFEELTPECQVVVRLGEGDPQATLSKNDRGVLSTKDGVTLSEYRRVAYLRLLTDGLVGDEATITTLMPLTNNEYLRAQNFLLNIARDRAFYDFPIRVSELTEQQEAVFPERQTHWEQLERSKNQQLTPAQQEAVSKLEERYPELNAQLGATIALNCPDGLHRQVIPGERKAVVMPERFDELF